MMENGTALLKILKKKPRYLNLRKQKSQRYLTNLILNFLLRIKMIQNMILNWTNF